MTQVSSLLFFMQRHWSIPYFLIFLGSFVLDVERSTCSGQLGISVQSENCHGTQCSPPGDERWLSQSALFLADFFEKRRLAKVVRLLMTSDFTSSYYLLIEIH